MNLILSLARLLDNSLPQEVANRFSETVEKFVAPLLALIGSATVVYAFVLGFQYIKAEDDNKRKEAKKRMIGALIGLLILGAALTITYMVEWDTVKDWFQTNPK